jgi:two-component system cell cycle sensor histidine kinase/response regulator CckA
MMDANRFAHDMRNQLGIILGYVTMLLDETAGEDPRRADLQEVRKAAEAALALLDRSVPPSREGV